ncbi:MAG: helix-turn-helix transcriptional regulator [Deltaproteobacteria bacterium]|nr:helix-turn-helix transcriptional regulator [Deltaproteobacteria bacterium]MBW2042659.1 helix-turn-helix transcriptional regulator [Deltaproteobacteria bacterium]MBW2132747.1 helix-turn-helix transcriptional regulator [Deltaproteobacteria bacterium]
MAQMLTTKEVARFLNINEKMVYSLVSEKGLPAAKVTGKWLFPKHLVEQWIEANTLNYPDTRTPLPPYPGLLILAGSNDPLLEKTLFLFNRTQTAHMAVFGNVGSMGGLQALRQNRCHMAASHLLQDDETDYNFDFASRELSNMPAILNFCRREQGILLRKGNPKKIRSVSDLGRPEIRIVNRAPGTGTRLLLDRELSKARIPPKTVKGYDHEVQGHIPVGLEILSGNADAGPGIHAVAAMLDLDFIPLRWERFDLMVAKDRFFDEGVQLFLGFLHEDAFRQAAAALSGYDLSLTGKMVYPSAPC